MLLVSSAPHASVSITVFKSNGSVLKKSVFPSAARPASPGVPLVPLVVDFQQVSEKIQMEHSALEWWEMEKQFLKFQFSGAEHCSY